MTKKKTPATPPTPAPTAADQPTTMADVIAAIAGLAAAQAAIDSSDSELAYLPDSYAVAANEFCETLAAYTGPVPFERAEAIALACRVAELWGAWYSAQPDEWPPADYYALRARLDELIRLPSQRDPHPKILADRKTNPRQIAVIWGLMTPAGTPDVDRVERIVAGTETLPAGHEPADAQRAVHDATAALAELRAQRASLAPVPLPSAPEPGSPDELDGAELTADQLAAIDGLAAGGADPEEIALEMDVDPERVTAYLATSKAS